MYVFPVAQLLESVCFAARELSLTAKHRPNQSAYCRQILLWAISMLLSRRLVRVRLDWTRSNAKQPKFDVIDSSRKVETGSQPFASCR